MDRPSHRVRLSASAPNEGPERPKDEPVHCLASDAFGGRSYSAVIGCFVVTAPIRSVAAALDQPVLPRQATVVPSKWRFLSTDPGRMLKWTWPSASTATTRTTARP